MKRGRVYVVEWEDSAIPPDPWMDHDDDVRPVVATTVGYLVRRSKKHVLMANSLTGRQMGGVMSIPRSAVRSMKRLA